MFYMNCFLTLGKNSSICSMPFYVSLLPFVTFTLSLDASIVIIALFYLLQYKIRTFIAMSVFEKQVILQFSQ